MNERYHPRLLSGLALAMGTVVGGQAQTPISEPGGAEATTAPKTEATAAAEAPAANAEHGPFFRIEGTDLRIGKLPPVTFHGFASQGFLASSKYNYLGNTTHGSFELSEFGLNASMSPLPRTRVSAQAFLFDVGDVGRYNPVLDYAMVDYNFRDEIGIRGGRVRRPGGIYNAIQDIDVARTSVLLPQGVYDARWRDFTCSVDGGSLYGSVGLGKVGSLSYEVYGGMASLSEQGGVARLLQGLLPVPGVVSYQGVNGFPTAGAQLWWYTPVAGLRAGVNLREAFGFSYDYNITPPFGPGHIRGITDSYGQQYSLEYQWRSLTLQTEYSTDNRVSHNEAAGTTISRGRTRVDAWYLGAAYRFNDWFELGSYYGEYYANTANRSGDGMAVPSDAYQKDAAISLRFDPRPWWVLKVEGHAIHGTALLYDNQSNPVRDEDWWVMLALKTTFTF